MPEHLTARSLTIVDDEGNARIELNAEGGQTQVVLRDTKGAERITIAIAPAGHAYASVKGRGLNSDAFLGELGNAEMVLMFHGKAAIRLVDADYNRVEEVASSGAGEAVTLDPEKQA